MSSSLPPFIIYRLMSSRFIVQTPNSSLSSRFIYPTATWFMQLDISWEFQTYSKPNVCFHFLSSLFLPPRFSHFHSAKGLGQKLCNHLWLFFLSFPIPDISAHLIGPFFEIHSKSNHFLPHHTYPSPRPLHLSSELLLYIPRLLLSALSITLVPSSIFPMQPWWHL